jgi:hypothetical protein
MINNSDLEKAIDAAVIKRSQTFGQYISKWGRVWRGRDVIAFVDDQYLTPSSVATEEEVGVMRDFTDRQSAEHIPGTDLPKLTLRLKGGAPKPPPKHFQGQHESVNESGLKETFHTLEACYSLKLVERETEAEDRQTQRFYEARDVMVYVVDREGRDHHELFSYTVTAAGLPPVRETIEKIIREELESYCEAVIIQGKSLSELSHQVALRLDASKRFLSKEPLTEAPILSRMNTFLDEVKQTD